ncbi:MAG TPA: iron-containing alcohol dehydrogenase [Spirochaetia bacterium]|nr:iron-containing alcohol dehydrogenase [Spirochaetia bacterium]
MDYSAVARQLLGEFKQDRYLYGRGVLPQAGETAAKAGKRAVLVRDTFPGSDGYVEVIRESLTKAGVTVAEEAAGAGPNAPLEDLARISEVVKRIQPDLVVSFGGGSTIDATKAAEVLRTLGGEVEQYFGTGLVSDRLTETGKALCDHVAIQTASSSGAHLTKYANITDVRSGQKKLIVDDAIVPKYPIFDYSVTYGAPRSLTMDGALDGIAHCLEVLYSSVGKPVYDQVARVAESGIGLVVENLPVATADPANTAARDALCLATDLGAYAIMLGGTNGPHLTSFSLVDVLSHGRACAMMEPYYTVFFAPAIEKPLRLVGSIYRKAGLTRTNLDALSGRDLGLAVAEAMFALAERIGFPTRLADVSGFTDKHIARALEAAKNPQLAMKLQNMPVPLTAAMVDEYMEPILCGARDGDLSRIKNVG